MYKLFEKIPEASLEYVKSLILSENITIKLKKSRKTKHGDFSVKKNGLCKITINDDLNQYRFLITLIHEISHYKAYKKYGPYVKPHGVEWKNIFKNLLLPIINPEIIPNDILRPLAISFNIQSAQTCSRTPSLSARKSWRSVCHQKF